MKVNPVPNDPAGLVAFAQGVAAVLSERSDELGISRDVEALLRASIGALHCMRWTRMSGHSRRKEVAEGTEVCGGS